jgi:phosphoribosylamine--glycine ligase
MLRHGIPTARYATFTAASEAKAYVGKHGAPIVIKADGLAAGKGVVVAATREEAHAAIDAMLGEKKLGAAGERLVIEEFLEGEEASFIVMRNVLPLATSQTTAPARRRPGTEHRRMGACSPAPIVTPRLHARGCARSRRRSRGWRRTACPMSASSTPA